MAKLTLTLEGVDLKKGINGEYTLVKTISLSTETTGETINFKVSDSSDSEKPYNLNLVNCKFQKKMYQPIEILADLQINTASGTEWTSIGRNIIESTFKHKQVKLDADGDSIGDDFYVHEVLPCYKKDSMVVKLKIYSLDKLLTLDKTCYSYVAKKLVSDIIKPKIADYKKPYEVNAGEEKKLECSDYGSSSDSDNGVHLQVLRFVTKKEERTKKNEDRKPVVDKDGNEVQETVYTYAEHIFPYLVQYNESFYDMLIRTCNRWGEFVYWEDKKLNIGYNSEATVKEIKDYNTITYPQQDSNDSLLPSNADEHYFPVGADDDTIRDTNAQKSKWSVKGKLGSFNGMGDVYMMQKFSQFFGTDKDPGTFAVTQVIDDLVDLGIEESAVSDRNKDYNGKYFPDSGKKDGTTDEQYGQSMFRMPDGSMEKKDALNEFTEINTTYNDAKYLEILGYEQKALNNVVVIDYDTVWPKLKLGNIIKVNDEEFIVTDISSKKDAEGNQVFLVEGIGKVADKFYPAMLPTGHVRYSGPQKAKIEEGSTDDPCDQNRVRVAFPWQLLPKKNPADDDRWVGDLSPRIRIASSDGGANMASRFYKGDYVFIGYVDGNIERPYVLGSVPNMGTLMNNVHSMTTPGGHALNLTDGSGQGIDKFMTTAFVPCVNTVTSFAPASLKMDNQSDWDKNKYFEGGFTLTDKYGIYRIAGSTENRSVSIMSPWGNVMINAFTGIQILAPNGNIKIVGKNVDIAAGNKLTLTSGTNIMSKLKGKNKSEKAFNWLTDLPAAVADKMSQKLLKVVDLTLVRSVVDIVMRPVEGTLTLKSMRFMKLEAGMRNQCGFPDYAYNIDKRAELKEKLKEAAISNMGATDVFGTIDVIKAIGSFVNQLATDFHQRSVKLIEQKQAFEDAIGRLMEYANSPYQTTCLDYTQLQAEFWAAGEYQEWTEDKLGFDETNVGIEPENGKYMSLVNVRFWSDYTFLDIQEAHAKFVCEMRASRRQAILDQANKLRKMICEVLNYEVSESYVKKHFKSAEKIKFTPTGCMGKILSSVNKEKILNSAIFSYPAEKRTLEEAITFPDDQKKYLKRAITYYLLKELGFDMSYLQNIDATLIDAGNNRSLLNAENWNKLISEIASMPIVEKEKSGLEQLGEKALNSVQRDTGWADFKAIIKSFKDKNIWGDGKEGRILIGADGKTFEFKDNMGFHEIDPIEPIGKTFKLDSQDISESERMNILLFLTKLKLVLATF